MTITFVSGNEHFHIPKNLIEKATTAAYHERCRLDGIEWVEDGETAGDRFMAYAVLSATDVLDEHKCELSLDECRARREF